MIGAIVLVAAVLISLGVIIVAGRAGEQPPRDLRHLDWWED